MMGAYVVLALTVCKIFLPMVSFNFVGILCHFVTYPKISHLHWLQLLPFDGVICNADSGGIIAMDWCLWLGMAQFFQGESKKNYPFFAI
jgi:hypothetical protein